MNEELKKKVEELVKDEEYMKTLLSLKSAFKMSEELKTKGIEISPEEIRQIGTLLRKKQNGELSDDELESISGGFTIGCIIGSILIGGAIAGGIAVNVYAIVKAVDNC